MIEATVTQNSALYLAQHRALRVGLVFSWKSATARDRLGAGPRLILGGSKAGYPPGATLELGRWHYRGSESVP
jgi:hypothetical protein